MILLRLWRWDLLLNYLVRPNVITGLLIRRRQRVRVREDMTIKAEVTVMALLEGGHEPRKPQEARKGTETDSILEPLEGRKPC